MAAAIATGLAVSAQARPPGLPDAAVSTYSDSAPDTVVLPTGPASDGTVPRQELSGLVAREAFRLEGIAATWQLTRPIRDGLQAEGWQILLDCGTVACGGFDFRFALDILPEPTMHVDLGDFRYLLAHRHGEWLALIASRRADTGYLQVTSVRDLPAQAEPAAASHRDEPVAGGDTPPLLAALLADGHAVLEDLVFPSNSTELDAGPYRSLQTLANWLNADPSRRVALVGHTDTTGSLGANIAVSRRRAQAVLERLASTLAVPRAQLAADGVGYLAPRASNRDDAGRARNRRVEVVLLEGE